MKDESAEVMAPKGKPIPDNTEAWKRHAHLLGDLIEDQRVELGQLRAKVNRLEQKLAKRR